MAVQGTSLSSILSLILLVILTFPQFGFGSLEYQNHITRLQRALDAVDLPCGSDVTVKEGERYMFDSRSAIIYESSLYAAQYSESSYYGHGRYRREATGSDSVVKNRPQFNRFNFHHHQNTNANNNNNPMVLKVKILPDENNNKNTQGIRNENRDQATEEKQNKEGQKQSSSSSKSEQRQQHAQKQNTKSDQTQASSSKTEQRQQQQRPQQQVQKQSAKSEQKQASTKTDQKPQQQSQSQQKDVKEKGEKKTQQQQEVKGRAYGSGGGAASYGHGGGNYGGHSSSRYNYGGHYGQNYSNSNNYSQAHSGGHQGGYTYTNQGYFQPLVCEWTYFADANCSLESHIIYFKEGDTDCNKQQFVISDNYTDFKMCGYKKLYPGFRSEGEELHIKYWRTPYVHRHVFKGYVTCTGRAQRPVTSEGYENQEGYYSYYNNAYNTTSYTGTGGHNYTSGSSVQGTPTKEESTFFMTEVNQEQIERLGLHTGQQEKPAKEIIEVVITVENGQTQKNAQDENAVNEEVEVILEQAEKVETVQVKIETEESSVQKETSENQQHSHVKETASENQQQHSHVKETASDNQQQHSHVKEAAHHSESASELLKKMNHHKAAHQTSNLDSQEHFHTLSENRDSQKEETSHAQHQNRKEAAELDAHEDDLSQQEDIMEEKETRVEHETHKGKEKAQKQEKIEEHHEIEAIVEASEQEQEQEEVEQQNNEEKEVSTETLENDQVNAEVEQEQEVVTQTGEEEAISNVNEDNINEAVNEQVAGEGESSENQNEITYAHPNYTYQSPSDSYPDSNYSGNYPSSYYTDPALAHSYPTSYTHDMQPITQYEHSSTTTYPSSPPTSTYQYPAGSYPSIASPQQYSTSYPSSNSPTPDYSYPSAAAHYPTSYTAPSSYPTNSYTSAYPNYGPPDHLSSQSETEAAAAQGSLQGRSYEEEPSENVLFHPPGYNPGLRPMPLRMPSIEQPVALNQPSYVIRPGMPAPPSGSMLIAYPFQPSAVPYNPPAVPSIVGRASASQAQPRPTGYQYFITSPANPGVKILVTCQLPPPYPCLPVQNQPSAQMPIVYGR